MSTRFTLDGADALERRLADTCADFGHGVQGIVPPDRLQAVLLGGGYGRGEGGVLATPAGDQPYNDLEFFVFARGAPRLNERRYGPALHALAHRLTDALGIEVEFKLTSLETLRDGPTTLFAHDLVRGHRVVFGLPDALAPCAAHGDASRIPLHEATRLLFNRCSGLLFAAERLARAEFTAENADFVGRNLAKLRLALGDVVLIARGEYHWSCRERDRRLAGVAETGLPLEELRLLHTQGVTFKLRPWREVATREQLLAQHQGLTATAWQVWSWLEARRLGRAFPSPAAYAADPANLCPESPAWKNALLRLRAYGPRACASPRLLRYPRESLFRALALLLWEAPAAPGLAARVARELPPHAGARAEAIATYHRLWTRFN